MFPEGRGVLQFRKVSGLEIQWSVADCCGRSGAGEIP